MNAREKQLMHDVPLMQCGNRLEFQQRLQWLSEGMLRNHLTNVLPYAPDQTEIAKYREFKEIA